MEQALGKNQDSRAKLDDFRWLVGSEAAGWLEILASSQLEKSQSLVQLTQRLRRDLPSAKVHLLMEQSQLRRKAEEKFPLAARMFFTPKGLEQATDDWVAAYKTDRFPHAGRVAELCCGIGGDLVALAQRGITVACDRDPVALLLAEANVRATGTANAATSYGMTIVSEDVAEIGKKLISDVAAWHIDPDRRPQGRRTTQVALGEPGPVVMADLLSVCPNAAIKLAPAATLEEPWWADAELEWISRARQCRQLVAWFGNLSQHSGQRRATVLRNRSASHQGDDGSAAPQVMATFVGMPEVECPMASQVGRYVFEPDPAILAAKLEGALALEQGLSAIAWGVAYFTGELPATHAALASFEVLETMPFDVKVLRQWLKQRKLGRLEIKKRGVTLEPEQLRRELQVEGTDAATILLMQIAGRVTAIVARRVEQHC